MKMCVSLLQELVDLLQQRVVLLVQESSHDGELLRQVSTELLSLQSSEVRLEGLMEELHAEAQSRAAAAASLHTELCRWGEGERMMCCKGRECEHSVLPVRPSDVGLLVGHVSVCQSVDFGKVLQHLNITIKYRNHYQLQENWIYFTFSDKTEVNETFSKKKKSIVHVHDTTLFIFNSLCFRREAVELWRKYLGEKWLH